MISRYAYALLASSATVCSSQAFAQVTVTAGFTKGAIAEYTNGANRTSNGRLFSELSISSIEISQNSSNGSWGGSQGNDTAVTVKISFTDGRPSISFQGAINWVKNAGSSDFDWVGITTNASPGDGFTPSPGASRTYILQFPQSSLSLASLAPDGLDGSANTGQALNALNLYFPGAQLTFTGTNATNGGTAAYSFDYAENRASGALLGSVASTGGLGTRTYSITGGNPNGWYAIDQTTGAITLTTAGAASLANDFEQTPNTQALTVQVTDGTDQTIALVQVSETNLDDTAPAITGPNGSPGAPSSAVTVNEGQTSVARLTAGEPVTWSVVGGPDASKFTIGTDGTITFTAAPDYETPGDRGTNNEYEIIVQATDASGNVTTQAIIVTVLDLDDTAPAITGPNGGPGAPSSAVTVNEGQTSVARLTAGEPVTWSVVGGPDASKFTIGTDGTITFTAAPDYETPTDSDLNNDYVLEVRAVDHAGNESRQTLTVKVSNIDELTRKLSEIADRLRKNLRGHAFDSLQSMLAFNEGLVQQGGQDACHGSDSRRPLTGLVNGNNAAQNGALHYSRQLNGCDARLRLFGDAGVAVSHQQGDWTLRTLGSLRAESSLGKSVVVGVGILASGSDERLGGFEHSGMSDQTVQMNVYGRARLTNTLRAGAFAGLGKACYRFDLKDGGLNLKGEMSGWRHAYGASLAGDIKVGSKTLTTEILLSRATEKLSVATLSAQFEGESRSDFKFDVGAVDATRLSIPVHVPFSIKKSERKSGSNIELALDPGLLCEDTSADVSKLTCGYQLGAKLNYTSGTRHRGYLDLQHESVAGSQRYAVSVGYARLVGPRDALELGVNVSQSLSQGRQDHRATVQLRGLRF